MIVRLRVRKSGDTFKRQKKTYKDDAQCPVEEFLSSYPAKEREGRAGKSES